MRIFRKKLRTFRVETDFAARYNKTSTKHFTPKEKPMQACYLAVDIGASSGRHIVGWVEDGRIQLQEVYRFENGISRKNGHLCWNVDALAAEVINGMAACRAAGFAPATMGIDTWAVDFVLLDKAGQRIGDAVAYRDERTDGIREMLPVSFAKHYARTGIQFQKFNTVYQLAALQKEHPEQLAAAETFLMIPDYLNYLLTGVAANEYTNATTTALVNAESKDWDDELIETLGLPRNIFQPIRTPGTVLGGLLPEIQEKVGFDCQVILPATHDTGSAFLAVPARDEFAVTLSSGTWSLLGVENLAPIATDASRADNFTNLIALTYVLPLTDRDFSRALWQSATECPVVFPEGVGVCPWMVPGGADIAMATSEKMKTYQAAVWAQHGLFASGPDFDITFGLAHTIEKAAEIYVKVLSAGQGRIRQTITDDALRAIAHDFGVTINEEFLD